MIVSITKFSELAGVSRQAVYKAIKSGGLVVRPDNKMDTTDPVNQGYIQKRENDLVEKFKEQAVTGQPKAGSRAPGPKINFEFPPEDISNFQKPDLERIKLVEQILDIRVKRQKMRDELIDRRFVKVLFSKIYTVDVNEFLTIKDKLVPDILGICGITDPEIGVKIGERMDDELWKTLKHIKQIIDDFLQSFGDEVLPDEN